MWKKSLFAGITVLAIWGVSELALAIVGVRPVNFVEDPYVGFTGDSPLFKQTVDAHGVEWHRTVRSKVGLFNDQRFPVAKTSKTYRVFCMGGSTTYGHPYDDRTSFCGWLRAFAKTADPSTTWEIINAGGVSYASYRVAKLMEELIRYKPDLFIIYSGHNEFLERRTYSGIIEEPPVVTWLNRAVNHSRVAAVIRAVASRLSPDARIKAKQRYRLTGEVKPLLDSAAGLDYYNRDEPLRRQIVDHFRFNLGRMVVLARSVGADVMFVQPPANVKDFSPFKSQHRDGLSNAERGKWQRLFDAGREAEHRGDHWEALSDFEAAVRIDDRYAQLHFELGRTLLAMGDYDAAKTALDRALVEDVCPLRILPEMNDAVTEVAREYGVDLIDLHAVLKARCLREHGHSILGNDDFLDHVHPTIEVNRTLGRLLVDALASRGALHPASDWGDAKAAAVTSEIEESLSAADRAIADGTLAKVLRWAGKEDEADRLSIRSASVLPNDPNALGELAKVYQRQDKIDEAIELYNRAIAIDPGIARRYVSVGWLLLDKGRAKEAAARFERSVRLDPNDAASRHALGVALSRQRRYDDALMRFREALGLDQSLPEIHLDIGLAQLGRGDREQAMAEARLELQINPHSAPAHSLMAAVYQAQKRPDNAIDEYREAIALAPDDAQLRNALGRCLLERDDRAGAIEQYSESVRLQPAFPNAHFNLAVALYDKGRTEEAQYHFERTMELAPRNPAAYYRLALLHRQAGDYGDAVGVLRRGVSAVPDYVPINQLLAWILAVAPDDSVRNGAEAVGIAEHACDLTRQKDARCLDALAAAYAEQGRFDEAVTTAAKAMELAATKGRSDQAAAISDRQRLYESQRRFRERGR